MSDVKKKRLTDYASCAGCAGKLPQTGIAQFLRRLPPQKHPNLLVGPETFDDAGVYRISDDIALVQTLDFFPPLVDHPFQFGQIAAANALSDVYAMGGEPLTAMNIVAFPDKELDAEILIAILNGGADRVREAGAVVVGGHSIRDAEVKYGLSVTGRVHPQHVWTNTGARPGDLLILTKPLGSGVLTSACKADKLPEKDLAEAISVMTMLNKGARDAGVKAGIHGCTDVTGYGLLGHALEMAEGSGVTITLEASSVPLIPRTLDFARQGVLTRAHKSTREYIGNRLEVEPGVEEALLNVLLDAQTSGGLLMSVPVNREHALVNELQKRGTICYSPIGRVDEPDRDVRLRVQR